MTATASCDTLLAYKLGGAHFGKQFKTERAAQQQRQIGESLLALMNRQHYNEISVTDICSQAGTPRRTFYYYFDSKEDVLSVVLEQLLNECNLETLVIAGAVRDELQRSLTCFFSYWKNVRPVELESLLRSDLGQKLTAQCVQRVQTEESWTHLIPAKPQEIQAVGSLLGITCVFYSLFYWSDRGYRQSPEQMAAYVTQLLTTPLYKTE